MDNYYNGGGRQRLLCRQRALQEVGCEVTLPDYQPEIKRLLWVNATPSAPESYIGGGTMELSGRVEYRILYAGHDGALYSYCHTEDYRYALPADPGSNCDPSGGIVGYAELTPESMSGRVSGPRRINLRCRLFTDAALYGMEERVELPADDTVQRLIGSIPAAHLFFGVAEPVSLGEEIPLESGDGDLRVISCDGRVFLSDAEAGSGVVICRGEVALKLLALREGREEPPFHMHRRIPFRQEVAVEGAEVNCTASAWGTVENLRVSVEEGRLQCDMELILSAQAGRNEEFSYVKDLYSTAAVCENRYADTPIHALERLTMANFTLSSRPEEGESLLQEGEFLVDSDALCLPPSVQSERGHLVLTGKCLCRFLIRSAEEYILREQEVPYRYEVEGDLPAGGVENCRARVWVIGCRGRSDGGRVFLDAEVAVTLSVLSEASVHTVKGTKMGELLPEREKGWTLCYPAPGDTLWSIGRRYCLPLSYIGEKNALPEAPGADHVASLADAGVLLL